MNVNEAALLAPEEIYDKQRAESKGSSELSKRDRKYQRRVKKKKQRMVAREREKTQKMVEKINPGLGNKYSKAKLLEKLKRENKNTITAENNLDQTSLTSSTAFFTKLQDTVRGEIHEKKTAAVKAHHKNVVSAQIKL